MVRKVFMHKTREQYRQEARKAYTDQAKRAAKSREAHALSHDLHLAMDRELQAMIDNLIDIREELRANHENEDSYPAQFEIRDKLRVCLKEQAGRQAMAVPDLYERQEAERDAIYKEKYGMDRPRGHKTISAKEGLAWAEDIGKRIGERVANANR